MIVPCPSGPTQITKLIFASASDMIATLVFLNHTLTITTLPEMQVVLEKI